MTPQQLGVLVKYIESVSNHLIQLHADLKSIELRLSEIEKKMN